MDRSSALARLGLTGAEDASALTHAYAQHLTDVQGKLVAAPTDAERLQHQTSLSTLVEAYEFLTQTGRFTPPPPDSHGTVRRDPSPAATQLSSPPMVESEVRMVTGSVLSSRIEIGALLGQGGMGYVYAARDRLRNEDVAIKVLRQDLIFSTAAKDRFLAEARVSSNLSHPNIVRVYDVGEAGGHYYLSMERLRGETLRQRIETYRGGNRVFSFAEVADIAKQLIDALRYAHRYIVHRDIKPENIWLCDDGTVKLMDFGIARAFSGSNMTQTGMTLGTAYYMAPEQRLDAKEVDWRADQYALGVVMYELLSGSIPMGAVKPLEKIRPDLPSRCAQAVMRAMSPRAEDRWASLDELVAQLAAPANGESKATRWMVLAVCTAAVAAAGLYYNGMLKGHGPVAEQTVASTVTTQSAPVASTAGPSDAGSLPPSEPPPESQASQASPVRVDDTTPLEAAPTVVAAVSTPEAEPVKKAAMPVKTGGIDIGLNRHLECIKQCERDDGECRSINRRVKQDCMRAVGFGATGGFTAAPRNQASADCAFYGVDRCRYAPDNAACMASMSTRYNACVTVLGGNVAARRQDCDSSSHEADGLCLDQLHDCRNYCGQ